MSTSYARSRDSTGDVKGRDGDRREPRRDRYDDRKDYSSRRDRDRSRERPRYGERRGDRDGRGVEPRRDEGRNNERDSDRRDGRRDYDRRDRDRGYEDRGGGSKRGGRDRRRSASPPSARPSHPRSPAPARSASRSVPPEDKAKPNFGASGLLAAETNTVRKSDGTSTQLKYNEPPEARKPLQQWRLYVFKGDEQVDLLHVARQSAYLFGRDHVVVDIPLDHPSCSKQHAVIQYRQVTVKDEFGAAKAVIKPYIIDLESTNGTHVNDETIPPTRFFELQHKDVIKFGQSVREYVFLHDEEGA